MRALVFAGFATIKHLVSVRPSQHMAFPCYSNIFLLQAKSSFLSMPGFLGNPPKKTIRSAPLKAYLGLSLTDISFRLVQAQSCSYRISPCSLERHGVISRRLRLTFLPASSSEESKSGMRECAIIPAAPVMHTFTILMICSDFLGALIYFICKERFKLFRFGFLDSYFLNQGSQLALELDYIFNLFLELLHFGTVVFPNYPSFQLYQAFQPSQHYLIAFSFIFQFGQKNLKKSIDFSWVELHDGVFDVCEWQGDKTVMDHVLIIDLESMDERDIRLSRVVLRQRLGLDWTGVLVLKQMHQLTFWLNPLF